MGDIVDAYGEVVLYMCGTLLVAALLGVCMESYRNVLMHMLMSCLG